MNFDFNELLSDAFEYETN